MVDSGSKCSSNYRQNISGNSKNGCVNSRSCKLSNKHRHYSNNSKKNGSVNNRLCKHSSRRSNCLLSLLVSGALSAFPRLSFPIDTQSTAQTIRLPLLSLHRPYPTPRHPLSTELVWARQARHSTSRGPMQTRRRPRIPPHLHLCQYRRRALDHNQTFLHTRPARGEGRRVQTKNIPTSQTCSQTATMARIPLEILVLCGTDRRKLGVLLCKRRESAQTIRLRFNTSSNRKILISPSFLFSTAECVWDGGIRILVNSSCVIMSFVSCLRISQVHYSRPLRSAF